MPSKCQSSLPMSSKLSEKLCITNKMENDRGRDLVMTSDLYLGTHTDMNTHRDMETHDVYDYLHKKKKKDQSVYAL